MPSLFSFARVVSSIPPGRLAAASLAIALIAGAPAPAFGQGAMTNGEAHTGAISIAGEIDSWTFTATAGDRVMLAIGETGGTDTAFVPWIRLLSPTLTLLASQSGAVATQIDLAVTATGTFTVQVASNDAGFNDTGTYVLTLAQSPGSFVVPAGDTGGALTNGSNHTGTISAGDLDMWSFTATAGDYFDLNIGEIPPSGVDPDFRPWIRIVEPDGDLVISQSGVNATTVAVTATITGTYTVVISSNDPGFDATGDYTLTLAKAPGAFTISGGDEGGALTNGSNHAGAIFQGDLDMWSFTATAGDYFVVNIGEVPPSGVDPDFRPWIRVIEPDGDLFSSQSGVNATLIAGNATISGTYTVMVSSNDPGFDAAGDYLLTLAKAPGAFTISGGDEGGVMTNGSNYTGAIHQGDVDMWSFTATAGEYVVVSIGETGGVDTAFQPWIRVIAPNGALQGSQSGALSTQIGIASAPLTGTYTVTVASNDSGFDATGTYTLTLARRGTFTTSGGDEGGAMINGENHAGSIHIGDLDLWTFTAGVGEQIALSVGEVLGVDNGLQPWIRLIAPDGSLVVNQSGLTVAIADLAAPQTGTYTVVIGSGDSGFNGFGNYLLTLAKSGNFIVPVNDEGGPMTTGVSHTGSIHVGDMDQWSFFAHAGNAITVTVTEDGSDVNFVPWIRLRSPSGAQIGSQSGQTTAAINIVSAPLTGYYTVVIATADSGNDATGQYFVSVNGNDPNTNIIQNGDFSNGTTNWQFFATPSLSYIDASVIGGVLNYFRLPPPPGTTNQAVAFQETGVALATDIPLMAQFDLANTSSVRKRISVLVIDSNFSDITVCTFWLAPGAPMRTYQMKTHTTKAWANAALYFYAASAGSNGGYYQIDNVSLQQVPGQSTVKTECIDPTAPAPPGGLDGPDWITNGDFGTGALSPWFTFGTITSQIAGNVFEFIKPSSVQPSGVVAQATGQPVPANSILTARLDLGNSSGVRKRVTVIVHDNDFSDLSACTFWLAPGTPLTTFGVQMFATKSWTNATLSVYPATVGVDQWIRLDNASLIATPSATIPGTACYEPGSGFDVGAPPIARDGYGRGAVVDGTAGAAIGGGADDGQGVAALDADGRQWAAVAGEGAVRTLSPLEPLDLRLAASGRLAFRSWLSGAGATAEVQIRVDGEWMRLSVVPPSDGWMPVVIDLTPFAGNLVEIRFVLGALEPGSDQPVLWRIEEMLVAQW